MICWVRGLVIVFTKDWVRGLAFLNRLFKRVFGMLGGKLINWMGGLLIEMIV